MDLSIIIPVYNTPIAYLQQCLISIQASTIACEYEIILINDGTTDEDTASFLTNYSEIHTIIINKENTGVSATRNMGVKNAKGEYILFLDSDDILLKEINNAINFLKKNEDYDLVYCDTVYFGDQKYYYKKGRFSRFKLLYMGNFLNISTLLRSSVAKKYFFDEGLQYAEDYDYWCRISNDGHKFKYLPKPFFMYRRVLNGNSLSQITLENKNNAVKIVRDKYNIHKEITIDSVNEYISNNFKDNKKLTIKLILMVCFPSIFNILKKMKIYRNNYLLD